MQLSAFAIAALLGSAPLDGASRTDPTSGSCREGEAQLMLSVFDESGAVLPGAQVTLRQGATRITLETNSIGTATACLPAARTEIRVTLSGFKDFKARQALAKGRTTEMKIALRMNAITCVTYGGFSPGCRTGPLPPPTIGYRWCAEEQIRICGL